MISVCLVINELSLDEDLTLFHMGWNLQICPQKLVVVCVLQGWQLETVGQHVVLCSSLRKAEVEQSRVVSCLTFD